MTKYKYLKLVSNEPDKIKIVKDRLCEVQEIDNRLNAKVSNTHSLHQAIYLRRGGALGEKGFCLDERFDWVLGRDDEDLLCLVPLSKS